MYCQSQRGQRRTCRFPDVLLTDQQHMELPVNYSGLSRSRCVEQKQSMCQNDFFDSISAVQKYYPVGSLVLLYAIALVPTNCLGQAEWVPTRRVLVQQGMHLY
jgi:hypothetical protein